MKTKANFLLRILCALLFLVVTACEQSGGTGESGGRSVAETRHFEEASSGLPKKGLWRNGLALCDLNQDGRLDICAPPPRKAPALQRFPVAWLQGEDGSWKKMPFQVAGSVGFDYGDIAAADFNNDGVMDFVLGMHTEALMVLLGCGDGTYEAVTGEGLPGSDKLTSRAVTTGDFNGDGRVDIAVCSEARFRRLDYTVSGLWVGFASGGEEWNFDPVDDSEWGRGLFSDQILTGDVNGDGIADLGVASLVARLNHVVWLGNGKGGFTPFNKGLPEQSAFFSIAFADIDRDGRDDLICSVSGFGKNAFSGLRVFYSRKEGFLEMSEGLPKNDFFTAVAAADLDGDGRVEIVAGSGVGGLRVYGQNDSGWKREPAGGLPETGLKRIYSIYLRDVNHDGKPDVVFNHATGEDTGGIYAFLNQGLTASRAEP